MDFQPSSVRPESRGSPSPGLGPREGLGCPWTPDSSASAAVTEDETGWLKQQTFLPIVLKARRCQARAQADVAVGEGSHPSWQTPAFYPHMAFPLCPHGVKRARSQATFFLLGHQPY